MTKGFLKPFPFFSGGGVDRREFYIPSNPLSLSFVHDCMREYKENN